MNLELSKLRVFNPFMPNVFSYSYQFDETIYNFGVIGGIFFFFFFHFYYKYLFADVQQNGQTYMG